MGNLHQLFENNRRWSNAVKEQDPAFFETLAKQQNPKYLWIGCSDSRVPANEIVGLMPGEIFVHRNVANVVVHTDLNCLSVIQFAVEALGVEHIIVTGHYGCGGIRAALEDSEHGLIDNWLRHVQDVHHKHRELIAATPQHARLDRLCELNVIEQVITVSQTTIVRKAWKTGQNLTLHGWIYGLRDGLLRDLGITCQNAHQLADSYRSAIAQLAPSAAGVD
jgi:carbonic anhydrase